MGRGTETQRLQEQWEQSMERAAEEQRHGQALRAEQLNEAAGLQLKSGLLAGGTWAGTCTQGCTLPFDNHACR